MCELKLGERLRASFLCACFWRMFQNDSVLPLNLCVWKPSEYVTEHQVEAFPQGFGASLLTKRIDRTRPGKTSVTSTFR